MPTNNSNTLTLPPMLMVRQTFEVPPRLDIEATMETVFLGTSDEGVPLFIQEMGGAAKTTAKGVLIAQEMAIQASRIKPQQCDAGDIVLGLKCGSSDTTSGLAANPALGVVVERLVAENAVAILGEETEFIGAEHLLAAQAKDQATGRKILGPVERMENRVKAVGVDMRGGQPTPGNIAGGLTTLFSGTPQQCYQEAWKALENGTDFLAPGCGVAPKRHLKIFCS